MSALPGTPRRTTTEGRSIFRIISESFWTAIALTIGLLAFFLVAGGPSIVTWQVTAIALTLLVLWGLHARSVRRHVDDVHHDERWRHQRERRGF